MKKIILLLFFSSICYAKEPRGFMFDRNGNLNKEILKLNIQDLSYEKMDIQVYDNNNNAIVDDSEKVNGFYVGNDLLTTSTPTFGGLTVTGNTYGIMPTGSILMYGSTNTIPTGFLYCDGSAISRSTYSDLFAIISTTYGVGDNSTTFNLPDFRGVFPKGAGTTTRAAGVDANGNAYAGTLGTYLQDKTQGHKHSVSQGGFTYGGGVVKSGSDSTYVEIAGGLVDTWTTASDGTNGTPRTGLTTEPQSLGINFIIKY